MRTLGKTSYCSLSHIGRTSIVDQRILFQEISLIMINIFERFLEPSMVFSIGIETEYNAFLYKGRSPMIHEQHGILSKRI